MLGGGHCCGFLALGQKFYFKEGSQERVNESAENTHKKIFNLTRKSQLSGGQNVEAHSQRVTLQKLGQDTTHELQKEDAMERIPNDQDTEVVASGTGGK